MKDELGRIKRVSDLLCTAHSGLRDRFSRRALILDILILGLSTWLVALAFVAQDIGIKLTPFDLDSDIWIGLLATGTFFLTIIQLKTNWKGRADAHKRTADIYAEVKRETGYLLAMGNFDTAACQRILARYDMASAVGIEIPENEFLSQKQRHKVKLALSNHLDTHPSASILLCRIQLWIKDNFRRNDFHDS